MVFPFSSPALFKNTTITEPEEPVPTVAEVVRAAEMTNELIDPKHETVWRYVFEYFIEAILCEDTPEDTPPAK